VTSATLRLERGWELTVLPSGFISGFIWGRDHGPGERIWSYLSDHVRW